MNPFDIFMWQAEDWPEPHPAVVISHPERAGRKDWVEVLLCSTQRAGRAPALHEFVLDQADGLDWPTLCKCDLIHAVRRVRLIQKRGVVAKGRRAALIRTVIAAHGWSAML